MGHWISYNVYAIRQSSKGWSDIIAICDSKVEAEAFCKEMYRLNEGGPKTNWRVEKLPKYGYYKDLDDEEQLPF